MFDHLEPRRLLADVGLDHSFGDDGYSVIKRSHVERIELAHALPDGRIISVHRREIPNSPSVTVVSRLTQRGRLDNTFGVNGETVLPAEVPFTRIAVNPSDGRMAFWVASDGTDDSGLFLLNADGSRDTSFSGDGALVLKRGRQPLAVEQVRFISGGRLLVTALRDASDIGSGHESLLFRVTRSGRVDQTFGASNGFTSFAVGSSSTLDPDTFFSTRYTTYDIEYDTDGDILLIAREDLDTDRGNQHHTQIYRFSSLGIPRADFGDEGVLNISDDYRGRPIELRVRDVGYEIPMFQSARGQIVNLLVSRDGNIRRVARSYNVPNVENVLRAADDGWYLFSDARNIWRLRRDLTLDTNWGLVGQSSIQENTNDSEAFAVLPNGKLALVRNSSFTAKQQRLSVSRFDGSLPQYAERVQNSAQLFGDTLVISGTGSADSIRVSQRSNQDIRVAINDDAPKVFAGDAIASVRVFAGGDHDRVDVRGDQIQFVVFGEGGDDRISGRGLLLGGSGRDSIFGSADGIAFMDGGPERDLLVSNCAALIVGGRGDDQMVGTEDGDTLFEARNDTLFGDGGADLIIGGVGADILYGNSGQDTLLGGAGNDELHTQGDSMFDGGDGTDTIINGSDVIIAIE